MIRRILHLVWRPRHPWRKISFTELSEMYLSGFLRTLSISMIGVFIPLYLLTNGYSFTTVLVFYTIFYGARVLLDALAGYVVARIGPKHTMGISFLTQAIFTLMLINLDSFTYAIPTLAVIGAIESSLYFVAYHVDFSKIKHVEHGGKELSFLNIMERVGGVAGPFIGGLLATLFSPTVTFFVATLAMLVANIILMISPEPVQTKQKLNFSGMLTRVKWRNRLAFVALSGEYSLSAILWPIYLAAIVFASEIYLKIGVVTSVSVLVAIFVALPLGKMLDKKNGKKMVTFGSIINALISLTRPFASSLPTTVVISAVHEPNMLVYRMPITKGFYDEADDYPGQRIAYIVSQEVFNDAIRFIIWLSLAIISLSVSSYRTIIIGFILAAVLSLLMNLQNYKALK